MMTLENNYMRTLVIVMKILEMNSTKQMMSFRKVQIRREKILIHILVNTYNHKEIKIQMKTKEIQKMIMINKIQSNVIKYQIIKKDQSHKVKTQMRREFLKYHLFTIVHRNDTVKQGKAIIEQFHITYLLHPICKRKSLKIILIMTKVELTLCQTRIQ